MSFSVTCAHVCVVLLYFVYSFVEVGAQGWFVDTAGQVGVSISQRLGIHVQYMNIMRFMTSL